MLAVIWGYFDQSVTSPISVLHIADMEAVVADARSSNTSHRHFSHEKHDVSVLFPDHEALISENQTDFSWWKQQRCGQQFRGLEPG